LGTRSALHLSCGHPCEDDGLTAEDAWEGSIIPPAW